LFALAIHVNGTSKQPKSWRAVHLLDYNSDAALEALGENLPAFVEATKALANYSKTQAGPKMLGHLFTTWGVKKEDLVEFLRPQLGVFTE